MVATTWQTCAVSLKVDGKIIPDYWPIRVTQMTSSSKPMRSGQSCARKVTPPKVEEVIKWPLRSYVTRLIFSDDRNL